MWIHSATLDDVPAILELQEHVSRTLPHAEMLYMDNADFYIRLLNKGGQISLAMDGERLVGCSVMSFPDSDDPENLGRDLGFSEEQCARVAHLEAAYILPEYRGKGLAFQMGIRNLDLATRAGRTLVCATAWPGNLSSLKNLATLGCRVQCMKKKYGGLMRYILLRDAENAPS